MKRSLDESHTQTNGSLIENIDDHRCLSWSEQSKCMWIHGKDGHHMALSLLSVHEHLLSSDRERHLWSSKCFN